MDKETTCIHADYGSNGVNDATNRRYENYCECKGGGLQYLWFVSCNYRNLLEVVYIAIPTDLGCKSVE